MDYAHLNHYVPPVAEGVSDAWRRALERLGDYTALVVRATNLRPSGVMLYAQTEHHLLVRISIPGQHVILRVAPEDDLAAYVFFIRTMNGQQLPSPRLIQRDLSRMLVPFAYTIESYVPGVTAATLEARHLLYGAARQAGRLLRRMHRVHTPGAGSPSPTGRWSSRRWPTVLAQIGAQIAPPPTDAVLFGEAEQAAISAVLHDPRLELQQPTLLHGNFGPAAIRCTAGAHVNLEAIVEPGLRVAGDGLFDLAYGLCPAYPAPWREGLLEGYVTAGPLNEIERERLPLLRLLSSYWIACHRYSRAEPHAEARADALRLLEELTLV